MQINSWSAAVGATVGQWIPLAAVSALILRALPPRRPQQAHVRLASAWATVPAQALQHIRQAMLESLLAAGLRQPSRLSTRIRYCRDPRALWELRSELMQALAAQCGEARAREEIAHVTTLFDGLVPAGLMSRPAPLR